MTDKSIENIAPLENFKFYLSHFNKERTEYLFILFLYCRTPTSKYQSTFEILSIIP